MDDKDVEINVEKGRCIHQPHDKLLFKSGSYVVSDKRCGIGQGGQKWEQQAGYGCLIEGHTDNVPVSKPCISDNWDLSVLRATAIVRVLQKISKSQAA